MLSVSITFFVAGAFTLSLGIVHLRIPAIVRYRLAIGDDDDRSPLGAIGRGAVRYELRRTDLLGIAWVMSNAASYVLISIGLVDLGWAVTAPAVAPTPIALWIAGWWAVRAISQHAIGGRAGDLLVAAWFWVLCLVHLAPFAGLAA